MQVLSLYLFLARNLHTVNIAQLRHMEQALELVVFARLHGVHSEVNVGEQRQILDITQLVDLADVVQRHVERFEALDGLQALEARDLILAEVQIAQHGQSLEALNFGQLIGAQVELFDP